MALARQDRACARRSPSRSRAGATPFDYAHANSVDLDTDGDFLMSARNTWAVYKIDRETGGIRWRLGGKQSTFKLPAAARFAWQHDAHRRSDGAITLFDNEAFPPIRKFSRALALRLDDAREDGVDRRRAGAPAQAAGRHPGQPADAAQRRRAGRLGLAALPDRVRSRRQRRLQRLPVARLRELPRLPPAVGRAAAHAPEGRRGGRARRRHRRLRELERRDRGRVVGDPRRLERRHACGRSPSGPRHGLRDARSPCPGVPRFVVARAKDAAGRVLSDSQPTRVR